MQEHNLMREQEVGTVTHYWSHLGVAGVHLNGELQDCDRIHVLGHTSDFEQTVGSMEAENHHVSQAGPGADVGIRVIEHAREHDRIYRLVEDSPGVAGNEL